MTTRFEYFGQTPLGQTLAALIDTPDRYVEFRAFSREGFPAVAALVSVLSPVLEPLRQSDPAKFDAAKQFVGWFTAGIMRKHAHVIVRKSASVPGKLFNVGAAWSGEPAENPITSAFDSQHKVKFKKPYSKLNKFEIQPGDIHFINKAGEPVSFDEAKAGAKKDKSVVD